MNQNEILRGHSDECLRDFGKRVALLVPKGSREASQVKQPIADFCGVKLDTVSRWLSGNISMPVGEPYIKLMCYLDMTGYRVLELEKMKKVHRNYAELIGYGLLTSVQAAEFLGYASNSTLYQIFQGREGCSDEKESKMWDLWKARMEELREAKFKAQELSSLKISPGSNSGADFKQTSASQVQTARPKAVISIMEGLLVLLEESELSESDLRQSADTVLKLSGRMSALSSSIIMSERRKGGPDGK